MNVEVKSIRGHRPIRIDVPSRYDTFIRMGSACIDHSSFPEVILTPDPEEPGGNTFSVPVHGVPGGYRVTGYRQLEEGDLYLRKSHNVKRAEGSLPGGDWAVLERTDTAKVSAPVGFKPVGIRLPKEGDLCISTVGEVELSTNAHQCPRIIVERHQKEPEQIIIGMKGFFSEQIEERTLLGYTHHSKLYQWEHGSTSRFDIGLDAGEVEVPVDVPEGYRFVRFGYPKEDDTWLGLEARITHGDSLFERVIVEPLRKVPTEAKGQRAWFRDGPEGIWEEGHLEGIGQFKDGHPLFVCDDRFIWLECEVEA